MNFFFEQKYIFLNIYILLICFLSFHCNVNDEFKGAKYIKDFESYSEYQEEFKNKKFNYGFLLIYSNYCPHCILFSSDYITLSEIFHNDLFFYSAMKEYSKYRKEFYIRGFPTILFYNNGSYFEYNQKRSISKISKFVRNYIPLSCAEISYNNIRTVINDVYNENDRNIIIGFLNDEKAINSFIGKTNSLKNGYVDLCYYVIRNETKTDRVDKKFTEMKENEIWTRSLKNGEFKFIFNETNYEELLFEKVLNIYEDINNNNVNLLERMKNKDFIFFVYNNDNMRLQFMETIKELYKKEKDNNFFKYYYILYNMNKDPKKISNLDINKIYHVSKDFLHKTNIDDLNQFLDNSNESKGILKETERINKDKTKNTISDKNDIILEGVKSEKIANPQVIEKINIKESISNEKQNSEIINEIKIDIKEEKINISNINNSIINEATTNQLENKIIIDNDIKKENEINEKHSIFNKTRRKFKSKRDYFFKNKYNKVKNNSNIQDKIEQKYLASNLDDTDEEESYDKVKIFLLLVVIILVLYIIITKYLCVGFIKVNDNQIIEFNNQPNTIEVI